MAIETLPEFSRLISISDIETEKTRIDIAANFKECNALANRFSIKELHNFSATLNLSKSNGNELLKLEANYSAKITQLCVVTLKPIINIIEGEFSSTFIERSEPIDQKSFIFDINDADPPEIINNGSFDAGELVSEYLSLKIDPFPRSNDANFKEYKMYGSTYEKEKSNPFQVLKKLKGSEN